MTRPRRPRTSPRTPWPRRRSPPSSRARARGTSRSCAERGGRRGSGPRLGGQSRRAGGGRTGHGGEALERVELALREERAFGRAAEHDRLHLLEGGHVHLGGKSASNGECIARRSMEASASTLTRSRRADKTDSSHVAAVSSRAPQGAARSCQHAPKRDARAPQQRDPGWTRGRSHRPRQPPSQARRHALNRAARRASASVIERAWAGSASARGRATSTRPGHPRPSLRP